MNTIKKQFSDALKREGKTITTYYKSESVKCLFRKNNDNNNTDNHITIFYDVSAPITQGQLLSYGDKQYITLNKESVDNDIYYKSSLLECNVIFKNIPCYAYKLSLGLDQGTTISTIDGNGELITEHTSTVENFAIGDTPYNIMNRWFNIVNTYNISGISHLILKVTVQPADNFALNITSSGTGLNAGDTSQITASCTNNGNVLTGQTVTYGSSDATIATVDSTGLVTALKAGTVTITGTWTEKSLTDTIDYTITGGSTPAYTFNLICSNPANEITLGGVSYRTFTPSLWDGSTAIAFTPTWNIDYNGIAESNFTINYDTVPTCKIKVAYNESLLGKTFTVTCSTTVEGINYTKSIVVTIVV